MLRSLLRLASFGCLIMPGTCIFAQQLPAPHAVGTAPVRHTGGLGHFSGGPDTLVASLDGRFFAMNDGSVWSVAAGATGELGRPLRTYYLSARGTWLAFAEGNTVKLWTLATGEVRDLVQLDDAVEHLTGSPDEMTLVAVTRHGGPQLLQVASGTRVRNFTSSTERPYILNQDAAVAFSPDGKLLACGPEVWTVATGASLLKVEGRFLAFVGDGRSFLALYGDHTIEEWDLGSRERSSSFELPEDSSDRFTVRSDGRVGVLSQPLKPNQLTIWDTHAGLQTGVVHLPSIAGGYLVSFLGNSDWFIAGERHALAQLVRVSTGDPIATLDSDGKNWSVVRSSDGAYDASADALTFRPRQAGGMSVDGTRIDEGHFTRIPGLLGTLPGTPTANQAKPHSARRSPARD